MFNQISFFFKRLLRDPQRVTPLERTSGRTPDEEQKV